MTMITTYLTAIGLIMLIAMVWIGVQYAYRQFAERHPEYGPVQEHLGCGMSCTCSTPCEERKKHLS